MEKECSELDGRRQEGGSKREGRDPGRRAPKWPKFLHKVCLP